MRAVDDGIPNGGLDGKCIYCGSPRRRMGWLGKTDYWLMCVGSNLNADLGSIFGNCTFPTLRNAQKRIVAEQVVE